ncbi:GNAT family N-acetyltransferase [Candidatus Omnitrophota bacterium]
MQSEKKITKLLSKMDRHYMVDVPLPTEKKVLLDFFKIAYSDQFNASYYQNDEKIIKRLEWCGIKNPNSPDKQPTSWICKERKSGKIVGHFGIMPVTLKHESTSSPAAWGRDLVVLPEFRKLGIGPFLVDNVLRAIKKDIPLFLVAGGNDNVHKMYREFGLADLGHIPIYIRALRIDNILKSKLSNRLAVSSLGFIGKSLLNILHAASFMRSSKYCNGEIAIEEIFNFDDSFDDLWKNASLSVPLIVKRDSVSLNWRFIDQPYWKYRIFKATVKNHKKTKGYIALREGKIRGFNAGIISDIFADSGDIRTIFSLINFAIKYFEKKGTVDLIRCDILHKDFADVLKKLGFMRTHSNSHFMITDIREGQDPEFVTNRNNWFVSYADSDLDLSSGS